MSQIAQVAESPAIGQMMVQATHIGKSYRSHAAPVVAGGWWASLGWWRGATGVAAMLESLATLNRLITAGKLPRPKRGIRVLIMGELYGSMHYIETHPERMRHTVAALCMDTPAASYDLPGTEYTFYMTPHVAKSYADALILQVAQEYFPKVGYENRLDRHEGD